MNEKHNALRRWQGEKYKSNVGEVLWDEVLKVYADEPRTRAIDMLIALFDKEYKALAGGLLVPVSAVPKDEKPCNPCAKEKADG